MAQHVVLSPLCTDLTTVGWRESVREWRCAYAAMCHSRELFYALLTQVQCRD